MKLRNIYKLVVIMTIMLMACDNDDPILPTQQELIFETLAGQWTLAQFGSIKVDGANVSPNYPGFALSFADGIYTTTNAGNLFSSSGTWEWVDDEATQVMLDDGKLITIDQLNTSRFVFGFNKSDGPVRAGIAGNYVITVMK